jgi:glycosyltransferase involved in cell wall biosynthesis
MVESDVQGGTAPVRRTGPRSVSVIIATRNRCGLLPRALESALRQSVHDTEVIVLDDGSTDGTAAVQQRFADPRLRWFSGAHSGVSTVRNRGVGLATGDWIAFLDDDDEWDPTYLEQQLAAARATGADVVCCLATEKHRDGSVRAADPPPHPDPLISIARGWAPLMPCVLVRREVLNRTGGFAPDLSHSEDRHLWLRLALTARWSLTPNVLAVVHDHGGSRLSDDRAAIEAADARIEEELSAAVRRRAGWRAAADFYWHYRGRRQFAAVLLEPPDRVRRAAARVVIEMARLLPRSAPSMVRPTLVAILGRHGYERLGAAMTMRRLR